jgi:drug/metabolite transporter (DMT)-like permease
MYPHGKAPSALNLCLLLMLGLLWGMPYALNKVALTTIPPITLVAARITLAAATLWIVVLIGGCKKPERRDFIPQLLVQGCFACLIPHTLIAFGQQSVDSALAAILNSTTPLYVCLISLGWNRRERLTAGRWFGAIIGLAGVVMIAGAGALAGIGRATFGQAAIIIATFSSAVGVIYGRRLNGIAPELAAAGTLTSAAVVLVPLCLCVEAPFRTVPSWASIGALAANAVGATALGFVIYFHLIRSIGSMRTASVGYLKPAIGVLIGCALMAEPLTWTVGVGLIATLIGVAAILQTDAGWTFLGYLSHSKAVDVLEANAPAAGI